VLKTRHEETAVRAGDSKQPEGNNYHLWASHRWDARNL
jgi:hypothetical protein